MFEHYSEHAQSVIERARQEAQKLRHDHIGTEHLLLGLIEVKDGCANYEKLPFTKHSISAINDALKEARLLKHATVGSEHILLGLLYENEGIGAQALCNLGFQLDDIRKDVLHFLSNKPITEND